MRSRIIVTALLAFLIAGDEVLAQAAAPSSAGTNANEAPPAPEHTRWATLARDAAHDLVAFPRRKSTWTLFGMGAVAALATHPADHYVENHVVGNHATENVFKLGKWVGRLDVEVGAAVGLWAIGRYVVSPATDGPRTNKLSHLGFDLMRAQILSEALVQGMKYSIRRDRPNGDCGAFPSGHAASAFAAAAVLERHLGYRASWPALAAATYVATSRLVDNRHFLSDVMFGASVGTVAGWTVVGRHGRSSYALQPYPVRGGAMVTFVRADGE